MRHYDMREVLERIGDCAYLKGIPNEISDWFAALVKQANSAHEAQKRYERALSQVLAGAIVDLAEADDGT